MIETRIGRHKVKLYNSIDDLPIVRFHRFNKMMLVDAGVGSDISDFDAHIERAVRYIRKGDNETAARELENMRQNVFLIMSEQSVRNLSFACLVAEVDLDFHFNRTAGRFVQRHGLLLRKSDIDNTVNQIGVLGVPELHDRLIARRAKKAKYHRRNERYILPWAEF